MIRVLNVQNLSDLMGYNQKDKIMKNYEGPDEAWKSVDLAQNLFEIFLLCV